MSSEQKINIQTSCPHHEPHIDLGEYLKSAVYGGLDGVINTLTIIAGGVASGADPTYILAVGLSVIIGDGLGMGFGDYLSAKAEKDFIRTEEQRQYWEVENKLEDEKAQIVEIYNEKGYTPQQSKRIAELYSTNSKSFVDIMMLEELGLVVDDSNPMQNGLVTFVSFIVFGFLPIIPYVVSAGINKDDQSHFLAICLVIGGIELFSLGFAKAVLVGLNAPKAGLESLILGSLAIAVGYGLGHAFPVEGH